MFSTSFSNRQIWRIQLLSPGSFCTFRNVSCAFLTRPHSRLANVSDRNHNGSVLWKRQMDLRLGVNMRRNTFTPGEGLENFVKPFPGDLWNWFSDSFSIILINTTDEALFSCLSTVYPGSDRLCVSGLEPVWLPAFGEPEDHPRNQTVWRSLRSRNLPQLQTGWELRPSPARPEKPDRSDTHSLPVLTDFSSVFVF